MRRAARPFVPLAVTALTVLGLLSAGSLAAGPALAAAPDAAPAAAPDAAPAAAGVPTRLGLGIRLLDAPAGLVDDPRAHSYVIDHVAPGTTLVRHLLVTNDTGHAAHVLLYPDAATIGGGRFTPASGHTPNELTSWITMAPAHADLAQGAQVTVTVTVAVPAHASSGERYAVLLADLPPASTGPGVHVESRVGIRVYLSVGFGASPPTDFTIDTLTALRLPDGQPEVRALVHNTGGRALDMRGSLTLSDGPGGLSAGPFAAQLGTTLAPGQSEPVTVPLDRRLPAGPWRARIVLHSDLVTHAAQAVITFPSAAGTSARPVRAHAVPLTRRRAVVVPVAVGLLGLVALGLLLFWWRRRRDEERRRQAQSAGPDGSVPAPRTGAGRAPTARR